MTSESYQTSDVADVESALIQREIDEAQKTIRELRRTVEKANRRADEAVRAHHKTVANLVEMSRECAELERDRDQWRGRAEGVTIATRLSAFAFDLLPTEVSAIRKAMARLHHPDLGGDSERLKIWNATLDPLEK